MAMNCSSFALLGLCATLAACGSSSSDGTASSTGPNRVTTVSGDWLGFVQINATQKTGLALSLTENVSGAVTGTGTLGDGSTRLSITVNGTYSAPTLSLTVAANGIAAAAALVGAYDGNATIAGTFNGSGFSNDAFSVIRQLP
jgi:hypothetical protein